MVKQHDDDTLIDKWRNKNHQPAYDELQRRHTPMVHQRVNKYNASSVPRQALEAQAWQHFDDAVEKYDPDAGAQFSTHLYNHLRGLDRYNTKHQNIARIPEALSNRIGDVDRASETLEREHGERPSAQQIGQQVGMDPTHVNRLQKARRQDLFEGKYEGEVESDGLDGASEQLLRDIRHEFSGQEQQVYDHLTGFGGKDKYTSKKELARELGLSASRISQITRKIKQKMEPHLQRL